MKIRAEKDEDETAVRLVNESAFGTPAEANLVDELRRQVRPMISLVAEDEGKITGHIMFSPVVLSEHTDLKIMGLAPMAVSPEHQRKGIGSALVLAGLDACRSLGVGAVVVLGHPDYYPRFGFVSAARFGIVCEYDVAEDVFMLMELEPGYMDGVSGLVKFHSAFHDPRPL